jgi:hypothetical protein
VTYATTNILLRVCQIESEVGLGTAFTIEVDGSQYLVTARHVLPNEEPLSFSLRSATATVHLGPVAPLPGVPAGVDIAVLPLEHPISPTYELVPTTDGMTLGQQVMFFGFPYGMASTGPQAEHLPLVKHGFVSALGSASHPIYLDGFNNPGFSGGPVTFAHEKTRKLHVAGVISGYRFEPLAVVDSAGDPEEQQRFVQANSGIIVVYDIRHAVDAIRQSAGGGGGAAS